MNTKLKATRNMTKNNKAKSKTTEAETTLTPLSDIISSIKEDLWLSMESRDDDWEPILQIKDVAVELNVRFESSSKLKTGIRAYVASFGGSLAEKEVNSHKIHLKLGPASASQYDSKSKKRIKLTKQKEALLRGTSKKK